MNRSSDILAELSIGPARYRIALAMIGVLVALLVRQGLSADLSLIGQATIAGISVAGIVVFIGLWRAGRGRIVLTRTALQDGSGRMICPLDNMIKVERGALAFKPSKGFLVRLKSPVARSWHPGLWWCVGTRLGVGGLVSPAQARMMAEELALVLSARDNPADQSPLAR